METRTAINKCTLDLQTYASYALTNPSLCKVVAVAEPRNQTRTLFVSEHAIPPQNVFTDWKDLVASGCRLADAVVVTVQDRLHTLVVEACAPLGYHVLCEKPLATTAEDCIRISNSIKTAGDVIFAIGHGKFSLYCTIRCKPNRRVFFQYCATPLTTKPLWMSSDRNN